MPKIVVQFSTPASISAEFKIDPELQPQGAAYLVTLAALLEKKECSHDPKLTDSCVILDVAVVGEACVSARYGNLAFPDMQFEMLIEFLRAVASPQWTGMGQLQQMMVALLNMTKSLLATYNEQEKGKIVLPGMGGFNAKLPFRN